MIMIQATTNQIFLGSVIIVLLVGVIQWLLSLWIKTRLEKSIQHEYDKKLEEYKFQQLQKQKAETIARFFSKWVKYAGTEKDILSKVQLIDFYEELNRMSFEVSLWIKDDVLLKDIMSRLENKDGSKQVRELVCEIRNLILEEKSEFNPNDIIMWPNNEIANEIFKK